MKGRIVAAQLAAGTMLLLTAAGNSVPPPPSIKSARPSPFGDSARKPAKAAAAPVRKAAAPAQAPPDAVLPAPVRSVATYRRFVHPNAKAMAGVDMARISSSPLAKRLASQIESMGIKQKASAEGMDFVTDIEKLLFSSPGELGSQEGKATLSEDAPFVVSMQGRFKIDKLRRSLIAKKAARQLHQGAELWAPPKTETWLAIVNSQLMLLGDRKSLKAALDAQAEGVEPDEEENPVLARAVELSAMYDLWLVSEASLEGLGGAQAAAVPQAQMLQGIDQFELGLSLREGLKADVSLHGRTPEDTSKLGTMLAGLKAMMALTTQQKKQPELVSMLNKLNIGTTEDRVVVSVQFSQKELDQGIETMMAGANSTQSAAQAAPPTPETPKAPLVVRIYNAEGGTREVPLKQ